MFCLAEKPSSKGFHDDPLFFLLQWTKRKRFLLTFPSQPVGFSSVDFDASRAESQRGSLLHVVEETKKHRIEACLALSIRYLCFQQEFLNRISSFSYIDFFTTPFLLTRGNSKIQCNFPKSVLVLRMVHTIDNNLSFLISLSQKTPMNSVYSIVSSNF